MTTDNLLHLNEEKLFNLIKSSLIFDLTKTDKYNRTDAFSNELDIKIELKCRTKHYPTLLIEEDKYNELIGHQRSRYITSTPSGVYSFNLKKIPAPIFSMMAMPITTEFGPIQWVNKSVAFLDIILAKNITELL